MLLLGFRADSRGSEARARQRQQLRQSAPWVEMQARHLKRPNGWPGSLTLDAAYASRHTLEVGAFGDCFQWKVPKLQMPELQVERQACEAAWL